MGALQRNKGMAGERELFKLLSAELGFVVERNLTQTRDAGCDSVSIPGFVVEVKRQEIPFTEKWMGQAIAAAKSGEIPVVFHRQSYQPWRMYIRTADLLNATAYTGIACLEFEDAVIFIRENLSG